MNRRSCTMRATQTKTKSKSKTTLACCCTGLSIAALSSGGGSVLAFAPSAASSTAGIRKRCQQQQQQQQQQIRQSRSAGSTCTGTPTSLRMTELLLSADPTDSIDALSALSASVSASSATTSARGLLSSFLGDSSFVGLPAFLSTQSHQPQIHASIQSLYLDYLPTDLLSTATRTLASTATSTMLDFSDTIKTEDPREVESELLSDAAHVALDLVTFASPTRALLRLSLCVGRMLAIAADWVPDHYLHPEELVFQCFMLSVSFGLLFQTALPVLPALLHQSTNRYGEKRAHGALFKRHGGLSWVQTKMVLAGGGAEWFDLKGGEVMVMKEEEVNNNNKKNGDVDEGNALVVDGDDGYLYWLQKGEAELLICSGDTCLSKERAVATASSSSDADPAAAAVDEVAILGELEFARKMQEQSKAKAKAKAAKNKQAAKAVKSSKKTKDAPAPALAPISTEMAFANTNPKEDTVRTTNDISTTTTTTTKIRAGPAGATLLRLDAARLLKLMDDDDALADGIRSIVFAGMQDKLRRVLQEDNTSSTSSGDERSSSGKLKSKKPVAKVNDGMQPLYAAYEPYEHDF